MHSLRRALTGTGTDAETESYFDMGADLQWQPSARALEAAGYVGAEEDEEDYEDEP